jgi:hypothetical protein
MASARLLVLVVLAAVNLPAALPAAEPTVQQVRGAVERALPFLERQGDAWIAKRSACNSCHTITFSIWGHEEARRRGFSVDGKKLRDWTDWAAVNGLRDHWFMASEANLEKLHSDGVPESVVSKLRPRIAKPFGREAYLLGWLAREFTRPEVEKAQARVLQDLREPIVEDGQTLSQLGDGGWGWVRSRKTSDPLTTGMVLYALASMREGARGDAVRRAWSYLLASQREDGSWFAPGTGIYDTIYAHWGTGWATIGLLRSLP